MRLRKLLKTSLPLLLVAGPPARAVPTDDPRSAAPRDGPERGIIATVNGEAVYFEDLERLLGDLHRGASPSRRTAPDPDRMVFRLVNDKLLAQEARAMGMQNEEPIPERLATLREDLAVRRLEQEEIWAGAEPTEDELQQAFRDEYRTITFRMITAHEREEAERLLREVQSGADLETLAREHSADPYAPRGGLVEDIAKIDMPHELAAEAFALEPGEMAGPIRTGLGWSSLRVISRADPDPERFEKLKGSVWELVRFRKAEALRTALATRLREVHPVVIERELADGISAERLPDARLMPKVEDPEAVVARVGERAITAERYGEALRARWKGVRNEEAALAAKPLVLDRLIRGELMRAEALARGYGDTPEVERSLRARETRLLVPRLLEEVLAAKLEVTSEEMESYYAEHRNQFQRPPRVHLGQITVGTEEEAKRLAELLRQGADLAWLARQHSTDRYKEAGGDRGWVTPGRTQDLTEEALFDAEVGDVLGPTAVGEGFVVVRVDAREEQGVYELREISGNIREAVYNSKFQRALHEYIQKLRRRSEIEVHDDVLATMRITAAPGDEKEEHGGAPSSPHP